MIGMFRRHPSRKALREWLLGGADREIESHIDTCERCASALESLDNEDAASHAIAETLATVLAPPGDLVERLELGVNSRLDSREMLTIMGDLFAAGLETTRLLLSDEPDTDLR